MTTSSLFSGSILECGVPVSHLSKRRAHNHNAKWYFSVRQNTTAKNSTHTYSHYSPMGDPKHPGSARGHHKITIPIFSNNWRQKMRAVFYIYNFLAKRESGTPRVHVDNIFPNSGRAKSMTAPYLRQENLSSSLILHFHLGQVQIQYHVHLWYTFRMPFMERK